LKTDLCLACSFLLLAEIGLRNDLQKFYLKVKSVEVSDHLAQLLILMVAY
jgi:hypothetical protein